jgi:hypothetical protein
MEENENVLHTYSLLEQRFTIILIICKMTKGNCPGLPSTQDEAKSSMVAGIKGLKSFLDSFIHLSLLSQVKPINYINFIIKNFLACQAC